MSLARVRRRSDCPRNLLTLCLITDRHRLVAQLEIDPRDWASVAVAQIEGAIAGGVDAVQIREKGLDDRVYIAFIRSCLAAAHNTRCRIFVNDRADLALAASADGVHLREDSITIAAVRRIAPPGFTVGRSIHDATTAVRAQKADYLIAGSVFSTASKPGQAASLGLDGLRAIVQTAGGCPVWAVGGVTAERLPAIVACGVRGVAAIGAFLPERATADVAVAVRKRTEALRFSLDGAVELP
jgi:thiamine-phosphate pyrophosphorylase